MALPTISATTSILGYKQWEYWEYQAGITSDSAYTVNVVGLPTGMTFNATTGLISGAASVAGVYVLTNGIKVTNTTGTTTMSITIGIEASAVQPISGVDLFVDVVTGQVTIPPVSPMPESLVYCKEGDDLLMYVRFIKGGNVLDLDLAKLQLTVKELEPEGILFTSSAWVKSGSGTAAVYKMKASVSSSSLASALSNYEADYGTTFKALAEIERVENSLAMGTAATFRITSRTFKVEIERDLGQVI